MFRFLVLCAFLQTLRGAPLQFPHANSSVATADALESMACQCLGSSDNGTQQLRSAYTIVQSCLLTLFTCVWTSIHPNINGPRDSCWTSIKRKTVIMFCAVIAPEIVFFWAVAQFIYAKLIAEQYNKEFVKLEEIETPMWRKIVSWFRPLPKYTTRRGEGQPWTTTHGFFIQMGGFILYENQYPKEVLDYDRLAQLIRDKAIDAPTVTERDLQDHGKGDATAKAIVVLQTTWFVVQCIARVGKHLPLSELEVLTLAFAVVNAAIYVAWWNKPQGVEMAICIQLKEGEQDSAKSTTPLTSEEPHGPGNQSYIEIASLPQSYHRHSDNDQPLMPPPDPEQSRNEQTDEMHSWLWLKIQTDRQQYSLPSFLLFRLPYRICGFLLRPFFKIIIAGQSECKNPLRVPMFHTMELGKRLRTYEAYPTILAPLVIGMIFGAIHLTAWASEFPSPRDLALWRISGIILVVHPFLIASAGVASVLKGGYDMHADAVAFCLGVLSILLIPFYIAARLIVISIAFKAIRHPPPNVLLDITWTTYIPHF